MVSNVLKEGPAKSYIIEQGKYSDVNSRSLKDNFDPPAYGVSRH